MRDFAEVVDGFQRTSSLVRIDGKLSNAFGIIRKAGANVVETCNLAAEGVEALNHELLSRGIPLKLVVVYKDVDYIDEAMRLVKSIWEWVPSLLCWPYCCFSDRAVRFSSSL